MKWFNRLFKKAKPKPVLRFRDGQLVKAVFPAHIHMAIANQWMCVYRMELNQTPEHQLGGLIGLYNTPIN